MKPLFYFTCMLVGACLLAFTATAQVAVQWDKIIGGIGGEKLTAALPTSDGGYLLAGYAGFNISGDKSEDSKGGQDFWIIKIDQDGKKIWDKTLGGSKTDYLFAVLSTSDGGYLLAGSSSSDTSGDKSEDSKGSADYWIVKVDQDGNKLWDKTFGGSAGDNLTSAISTSDGGYLLGGTSNSNASGDKSEDKKGQCSSGYCADAWIIKIDADGNKLWDKTLGGNVRDEVQSLISAVDGGYLIVSSSNSDAFGDKSEGNKGGQDYWIIKVDQDGNKLWDKTIGGESDDFPRDAILTTDGGFLLAGSSNSDASGDKSEDRKGGCATYGDCYPDYWIVKIDEDGNKIWDKTLGGNIVDDLRSIIPTTDAGYLLAGESNSSASGDKSEANKEQCDNDSTDYICKYDYWLVKIDEDGNKIWDKTLGGDLEEFLGDALSTADGGYLLAGISYSDASGDKSEDNYNAFQSDYWIVKVASVDSSVQIQNLTLIDAVSDSVLQPLQNEDTINLALASLQLSVGAIFDTVKVGSILFEINGPVSHKQTENQAPFVLFGDELRYHPRFTLPRNINGRFLPIGNYSVTATPFEKINKEGKAGIPISLSFTVIYESEVSVFDLYDAVSNQKIMDLTEGSVIYKDDLEHEELTVLIHTTPEVVGSVKLELDGPLSLTRIENTQPYNLFRNYNNDLYGKAFPAGEYHLKATPYLQTKARGYTGKSLEVSFTVIGEDENNARLAVYPVPTSGALQISYDGSVEPAQMMLLDFTGQSLVTLPLQGQTQLDLSTYRKGIYYLKVIDKEAVHLKRIVLE